MSRSCGQSLALAGMDEKKKAFGTAPSALVHSTAEYCTPVWCRSAHNRLIDPVIKDTLRMVTGCLRPATADNLPILAVAVIQLAELRRKRLTLFSAPCHGAWRPAPLNSHLSTEWKCTTSQMKTSICTRRTTTHQFIGKQQPTCDALGGSPIEFGVVRQQCKTPY